MQREIVLDTETTGLDARGADRVIEIGCVEIFNRIPTGREFHRFINPERDVPAEAERIHGISSVFLVDKPVFAKVAAEFLDFIGDDTLVIHNAQFDIGFLNAELERVKKQVISFDRVVDTLQLARRKHPAGPNTLDGLCKRYGIDNSKRTKHGALMDSELLAQVYVELLGERQATLGLARNDGAISANGGRRRITTAAQRPNPLPARLSADDIAAHRAFAEGLGATAMWRKFFDPAGT
jgi:DNA polymerase III subunit epsilon